MTKATTSSINGEFSSNEIPCLLTEPVRLAEQIWPENTDPVLSIFCLTYNHGKFIREAIEGFLMQETTFPVEIFIHDDASTDGTAGIVGEYALRYPSLFKVSLQNENQFRKNNPTYFAKLLCGQKGEFIALCEGDDRWTDALKLMHQIEYLKHNTDCSGCFHASRLIDSAGGLIQQDYFLPSLEKHDTSECISSLASAYSTCSLVFRRKAIQSPPVWFQKSPTDLFLELQISRFGKVGFVDRNMSDYRSHGGGIWSGLSMTSRLVELIHRYKTLLEEPEFAEKHAEVIKARIDEFSSMLCCKNESESYEIISRSKWVRVGQALGVCHKP
jgi:hypothetical protein